MIHFKLVYQFETDNLKQSFSAVTLLENLLEAAFMDYSDKKFRKLYETDIYNKDGLNGYAYVEDGISVPVSDPLIESVPGTNPEQLLGLSLSTCLNATLQAIEKAHNLKHTAQVHVRVTMVKGTAGLEFLVHGMVSIPAVDHDTAVKFLAQAETRCPVSKLLSGNANYTLEVVDT